MIDALEEECMNRWILVVLMLAGVVGGVDYFKQNVRLQNVLKSQIVMIAEMSKLKMQLAKYTTGPCGDKFVVSGLGMDGDLVAVAGKIGSPEHVINGRFFVREVEIDGVIYDEVVEQAEPHNKVHFRRPRQPKPE